VNKAGGAGDERPHYESSRKDPAHIDESTNHRLRALRLCSASFLAIGLAAESD